MASIANHDDELDFVETPSRDFFCPVTQELLRREPHQTLCCGNHISPEAVASLQKRGKPCPICKEASLKTVPDKFFKRKVNEMKVRCPRKRTGCAWAGPLGELASHLSVGSEKGDCGFEEVACTYHCGRKIQRRALTVHMSGECSRRPSQCKYCGFNAAFIEIVTLHYAQCENYPVECPNECGEKAIKRCDLPSHQETCPLEVIACQFSHTGCTVKLQRGKMADHIRKSVEEHLSMAGTTIEQQTKTIATLQQQAKVTAALQQQLKQLAAHLKPESLAETPSFIFIPPPASTMTNFTKHKSAGDIWYGPPFYSRIGGYKMCLRVDANGWGDGANTHVSVSVYLMRGEYDDDLLWPFRGDITLQLINLSADDGHVEKTIPFNDSAPDDVADRVVEGKRAPRGQGWSQLISHSALCYDSSKNTEYLKNDSLRFQVTAYKLT